MKYLLFAGVFLSASAFTNPNSGSIVSGDVSFSETSNGLTINQVSDEAWIDWPSFNISVDEWVHFNQLTNGLTVNRVTGNDLSEIYGQLSSTGTIYLINPNGILFSESSRVDVGGLFVTDHWLAENGTLSPSYNSKGIKNLGKINSRTDLTLLAANLINQGELNADNVSLIANAGALLNLDDQGLVSVLVPADGSESWIENTGAIVANGQIYLGSADKNDWLNELAAEQNISVSGELNGNEITIQGSQIELIDAELTAQLIDIESRHSTHIGNSQLHAVDNIVRIRGEEIQLFSGSSIDVGSGQLTIGGYYQGQGSDRNANFVHVSSTVNLYGNGGTNGDGGEIILWSDGTTSFHGNIETKGGTQSGDGGFVEVSGKETLVFRGEVNTQASNGQMGTLLLDPDTITIADGSGASADTDGVVLYADYSNADITIYETDLEGIAAGTNINLQADETITINDLTTDGVLSLNQTGSVTFAVNNDAGEARFEMLNTANSIDMTGGGTLNINLFGNTAIGTGAQQTSTMIVGDINMTAGGNISLQATTNGTGTTSDEITISVEDITITGDGDINIAINNAEDNDVGITQVDVGNITVTGSGGNGLDITASNTDLGAAVFGSSTINLNGDIDISGDGSINHYVDIQVEEDGAAGGTINNYGDINSSGGDVTISAGTMELLDPDLTNIISALNVNAAGGDVDLTAFGANTINGNGALTNGQSFNIETTTAHNLDWNEFTNVYFLKYQTTGDVDLGTDGAKNISNAELTLIDASATRLTVQTTDNITTTSAVIDTQLALFADRDGDGTGDINLNGLNTTNSNLTLTANDISLLGNSVVVGTGNITINSAGDSISVNGSEDFNIETGLWDELNNNTGTITIEGVSGASSIWWEESTLGGDVVLDGSAGAGIVFQNGPFTFGGTNTLQLIGDTYVTDNLTMTDASSTLDIDGDLFIGAVSGGGGDTVSISANWDAAGLTSVDLIGDAGDFAVLSHTPDTTFTLPTVVSANSVDLNLESNGGITTAGVSAGNLDIEWDLDSDGTDTFTTTGTYSVADLNLFGHGSNDDVSLDGTWTISGDVTTATIDTFNVVNDTFTANSFDFTGANTLAFGSGSTHALTASGGNISMPNMTSNRRVNIESAGTISFSAITTSNDRVNLQADDVTGDGSAINLGTGTIDFRTNPGDAAISIGDAGVDTFTIEANIWDNLTVGNIRLDGFGVFDTVTFLEDTLPANLFAGDGGSAQLIFDGVAQNFSGATVTGNMDVTFLQDFTTDSLVDFDRQINIGATDGGGGDSITLTGDFDFSAATGIDLLGDTGDTATIIHTASALFDMPAVVSSNGDPNLTLISDRSITVAGIEAGVLTVTVDNDNNSTNYFETTGAVTVDGFSLTGNGGDDDVWFDENWIVDGSVTLTNIADINIFGDSFIAAGDISFPGTSNVLLGTSGTAFNLTSTAGNIIMGDLTGNRPVNISATGALSGGYIDAASNATSLTSDSDLAGDEAITLTDLRVGDLTIAGDMTWGFNPNISGDYVQSRGDLIFSDATVSGFGIDLTSADSVTLTGTANILEARSGAVTISGLVDDGSNANLSVLATGAINATSINTGTGDLTLESDTNSSGGEVVTLNGGAGAALTLNSDAILTGTLNYNNLSSANGVTLTDVLLTISSLDNSTWASTSLSGSSNSITSSGGNSVFAAANDDGSNADLILTATGSVSAQSLITGTGNLTLNSDSDSAGSETISLGTSSGGTLTLSDQADLSGTLTYSNLVSTSSLSLTDSVLSVDAFDDTALSSLSFNGSGNTLRVTAGDLLLSNPTVDSNSDLQLFVAAGVHTLTDLNIGTGDILIDATSGSSNQIVTAEGAWAYNDLTVANIDTFNNNANLVGVGSADISVTDDIVFADGTSLSGTDIILDSGDDLTITGLEVSTDQIPGITLIAGGDLFDAGDILDDVSVFWPQGIEIDVAGSQDTLDYDFGFAGDISDIGSEVASVTDSSVTIVEDSSESSNPVDSANASVGSLPKNRVDVHVPECSGNQKNCRKTNAMRKFLSALLIGGALPE